MAWFTNDFDRFFKDLAKNNNKDWFDAQRERYQRSVKEPFAVFVAEAIARIAKKDRTVAIEARDAIFRINRDIRFSKDKAPYKLEASALISPEGRKGMATPGIYFALGPEAVRIYGGCYMPERDQLHRIRTAIVRDGAGLRKAISGKGFKTCFGTVQGEVNKVLPAEFKAIAKEEPLIANKQFYVGVERPARLKTDPDLLEVLMEHWSAMAPLNAWLAAALRG